jgi:hypothetical protein
VFTVATKIAARLLRHRQKGGVLLALSVLAAFVGGKCGHPGLGFFDGPLH